MSILDESFDIAVISLSLGISGIIFIIISLFLKLKYTYHGGVRTTGKLVAFRKLDNDHYIGALQTAFGYGKYEDYNYNVANSKPVFVFHVDGKEIISHSEWSIGNLDKNDIGKNFPIRIFFNKVNNSYRVILEGKQYENQRTRGRRIIFGIFFGIGIFLFVLGILFAISFM